METGREEDIPVFESAAVLYEEALFIIAQVHPLPGTCCVLPGPQRGEPCTVARIATLDDEIL
jgi:hypothetical protein